PPSSNNRAPGQARGCWCWRSSWDPPSTQPYGAVRLQTVFPSRRGEHFGDRTGIPLLSSRRSKTEPVQAAGDLAQAEPLPCQAGDERDEVRCRFAIATRRQCAPASFLEARVAELDAACLSRGQCRLGARRDHF